MGVNVVKTKGVSSSSSSSSEDSESEGENEEKAEQKLPETPPNATPPPNMHTKVTQPAITQATNMKLEQNTSIQLPSQPLIPIATMDDTVKESTQTEIRPKQEKKAKKDKSQLRKRSRDDYPESQQFTIRPSSFYIGNNILTAGCKVRCPCCKTVFLPKVDADLAETFEKERSADRILEAMNEEILFASSPKIVSPSSNEQETETTFINGPSSSTASSTGIFIAKRPELFAPPTLPSERIQRVPTWRHQFIDIGEAKEKELLRDEYQRAIIEYGDAEIEFEDVKMGWEEQLEEQMAKEAAEAKARAIAKENKKAKKKKIDESINSSASIRTITDPSITTTSSSATTTKPQQ